MDEIRVIARALARAEKEEQLRNTLVEMLTPRALSRDADSMSSMSPTTEGKVQMHSIATWRHRTISS